MSSWISGGAVGRRQKATCVLGARRRCLRRATPWPTALYRSLVFLLAFLLLVGVVELAQQGCA